MSDSNEQSKSQSKKTSPVKNDKNMKRYSETEKTLLYELFERYQEIIDIKLRRSLYSSTKQCEVRECWELILKSFNENPQTSERTLKQLQKFWLNAKLRRMIPNKNFQGESNRRRASSDVKLPKNEPPSIEEPDCVEIIDTDYHHQTDEEDEEIQMQPESDEINIKYVVPSSLIIREHQTQQEGNEMPENCQQNVNGPCRQTSIGLPNDEEIDASDHNMQDVSNEVLHTNDNSFSNSNQEKIDNLQLQEMHNRVCESQLRCEVQKLLMSKAEEEYKHLKEINKLRLQEALIRLKLMEQNYANGRANPDMFNNI